MTEVIRAEFIAFREDVGGYIIYVFQNLANGTYEMCTRLPNWEAPFLVIGDTGFLKYKSVQAGKDTWYNSVENRDVPYKRTDKYFVDFVYERPQTSDLIL